MKRIVQRKEICSRLCRKARCRFGLIKLRRRRKTRFIETNCYGGCRASGICDIRSTISAFDRALNKKGPDDEPDQRFPWTVIVN